MLATSSGMYTVHRNVKFRELCASLFSLAAVTWVEALRDDASNGCEGGQRAFLSFMFHC